MPHGSADMPIIVRNVKESDVHKLETKLDALLAAFESHPEMKTPAQSSPKGLYNTYDFTQTTRTKLLAIPIADLKAGKHDALEAYSDCLGRCMMSQQIICDESGMMSTMMTGGQPPVDFGKDVRDKAKELDM